MFRKHVFAWSFFSSSLFAIVRDPAFLSVGWEKDGREGACEAKTRSSACFIWVPGERDYGAGMRS